jgi:hypothetical protein
LTNALAPINRIPPEILTLIPTFWPDDIDGDWSTVTLTHVCRSWREIFISCSSLWTCLDCENADKTRVYLERSKSSPITLWLDRGERLLADDPFFEIDPRAISHLKYLDIQGSTKNLQDITRQLSHPAPLLEKLTIEIDAIGPVVTTALFNGDFSSLRELILRCIHTSLPWKNMVNLTFFLLAYPPPGEISTGQLLDFFDSAPHLREVELSFISLAPDDQNGRLVPLMCLKSLLISGDQPTSLLLDHLLIPTGARLTTELELRRPRIKDHLPKSLGNLKNLPGFTRLRLYLGKHSSNVKVTGPNGIVSMVSTRSRVATASLLLGSLARLNAWTAERLKIIGRNPLTKDLPHQVLLPMKDLRALTISRCENLPFFVQVLDPDANSLEVLACPKLEELVLRINMKGAFDIWSVIGMAAARARWGVKLKSIRISRRGKFAPEDMLELGKHALHVECDSEKAGVSNAYGDSSDEED